MATRHWSRRIVTPTALLVFVLAALLVAAIIFPGVLKHPLCLLLVGLVFSAYLVPRWQNRQWELQIKTSLVAEMSECVMKFVTELEHYHPLAQVGGMRPAPDGTDSSSGLADGNLRTIMLPGANEVLKQSYRNFDISRCIIGTKLEVYYPDVCGKITIHQDWQEFAETLIALYKLHSPGDAFSAQFSDRLRTTLSKLGKDEGRKAEQRAKDRHLEVDARWGRMEQCLLAEKHRIITEVRETHVKVSQKDYPGVGAWR